MGVDQLFAWKLFRDEFRAMYGAISVMEICSNPAIAKNIENIEYVLRKVFEHGSEKFES